MMEVKFSHPEAPSDDRLFDEVIILSVSDGPHNNRHSVLNVSLAKVNYYVSWQVYHPAFTQNGLHTFRAVSAR